MSSPKNPAKDNRTGLVTTYTYDSSHNLIGSKDPFGFNAFGNAFDVFGMASNQTDERGNVFSRSYDMAARKETVTNTVIGKSTTREYDSDERVTKETDYLGNVTSYTYSETNRLPASITDPRGHKIDFVYDSVGRVTKIIDPDNKNSFGATLEINYNFANGKVDWTRDARDVVRTFVYDSKSNLTEVRETLGVGQTRVTKYTYDSVGNLTSVIDSNNRTESFTYDSLGNLIDTKDGFGIVAEHQNYDSLFRLTSVSDALNRTTGFSYNNLDQLTEVQTTSGTVNYTYENGHLSVVKDARLNETRFTYDPTTGDLRQVIDPSGGVSTYTYDSFGRLDSIMDPNGQITVFDYDDLGRLIYAGADYNAAVIQNRQDTKISDTNYTVTVTGSERIVEGNLFLREKGQTAFVEVPVVKLAQNKFQANLTNLKANVDYEYEVRLLDRGRNEARYGTFLLDRQPPTVANQFTDVRVLSGRFNLTANEALSKAILKVIKKSDGSEKQIVLDNWNQAAVTAEISGLIASTEYEYSWELTDMAGNKMQTPKVSFTTQTVDDPFFIINEVTGTNVVNNKVTLKLKLARSGTIYTLSYRRVGSTNWTTVGFLGVQDGSVSVPVGTLLSETDYEYKVSVSYLVLKELFPGGPKFQLLETKTSQIQPFKTGSL